MEKHIHFIVKTTVMSQTGLEDSVIDRLPGGEKAVFI